jgi:hypothetical protein
MLDLTYELNPLFLSDEIRKGRPRYRYVTGMD